MKPIRLKRIRGERRREVFDSVQSENGFHFAPLLSKLPMSFEPPRKIPILTYHSIDASGSVISTAPEVFRRQMRFLSAAGYRVISLEKLIEIYRSKLTLSGKIAALTFDDGFRNLYTEAFPILEECGFAATVFLVTDYCGKYNDWRGNPPHLPRSRLLSWREIRELNAAGIEFGAHTAAHPDLTAISNAAATGEITRSKAVIEEKLGTEAKTFAYPYGKFNPSVKRLAAANFQAACSTDLGKTQSSSDFFALERIDSYYLSNEKIFASLASKSFERYLQFRRTMRRCKAAFGALHSVKIGKK